MNIYYVYLRFLFLAEIIGNNFAFESHDPFITEIRTRTSVEKNNIPIDSKADYDRVSLMSNNNGAAKLMRSLIAHAGDRIER